MKKLRKRFKLNLYKTVCNSFFISNAQEDFRACFAYFNFEKMESTRFTKVNRKTTTRIILFFSHGKRNILVGVSVNCFIRK